MKHSTFFLPIFLLFTLSICSFAQTPQMVHNFNPDGNWLASGSPSNMIAMGSKLYFSDISNNSGKISLYESDGTDAGTFPLNITNMDISSYYYSMIELNGKLYFQATEVGVNNNYEPWISDGTEAGTYKIKDIYPNGGSISQGSEMTVYKNEVYFKASDNVYDTHLWKTNGTAAGTVKVKNISIRCCSNDKMIVFNNELYFCADDNTHGDELWKTDGTTAGTVLVADISPGSYSSTPSQFTIMNNFLYFSAEGSGTGRELYKTNGTAAGTVLVKDINPGQDDSFDSDHPFIAYNSELYFNVLYDDFGRSKLFKSDGTAAGTIAFSDMSLAPWKKSTIYNGKLYFAAYPPNNGLLLCVTDGTEAGTKTLVDGSVTDITRLVNTPHDLTVYNGMLYYMAEYTRDYITYKQLMQTDGTSEGTIPLTNERIYSQPGTKYNICVSNGHLFFEYGTQLWKLTTTPPVNPPLSTGILNSTAQENNITIYPNPASALVAVDFKDIKNVVSLSVYTSTGVLIKQIEIDPAVTSTWLDVQHMNSGLYYVVLMNASGEQLSKKLIKN